MCDFKPGDEVVCVNADHAPALSTGSKYVVTYVGPGRTHGPWVSVEGVFAAGRLGLWAPSRFRKVQRWDLSAWLETAAVDTDHLDKPIKTPARPKVDALRKRVRSGAFG